MTAKTIAILLFIAVCWIGAAGMSYFDDAQDAKTYCENVRDGVWPDFKQTFSEECK